MKKSSLALALALSILSGIALSACNTTEGAGKDISNAGQDLSNSAAKNK